MDYILLLKKTWHFIWEEDSLASWIVNVILAFVLIKFVVYPGLGFMLGTSHPIVAVVSGSMEHNGNFDEWWPSQSQFYSPYGITKSNFEKFSFRNGFNTGDIMILLGADFNEIKQGDVVVFMGARPDPIIHRVIVANSNTLQTKGDHNTASNPDETNIRQEQIIGKAWLRVPWLGWVKIAFVKTLQLIGVLK